MLSTVCAWSLKFLPCRYNYTCTHNCFSIFHCRHSRHYKDDIIDETRMQGAAEGKPKHLARRDSTSCLDCKEGTRGSVKRMALAIGYMSSRNWLYIPAKKRFLRSWCEHMFIHESPTPPPDWPQDCPSTKQPQPGFVQNPKIQILTHPRSGFSLSVAASSHDGSFKQPSEGGYFM